jgi:hypothetical protein
MKNMLLPFAVLLLAAMTPAEQELLPVTQENEYRCKADTVQYYEDYQKLATRLPYGEVSKRANRMNHCSWLFSQLVIRDRGRPNAELDIITSKADAVETVYQTAVSSRLTAYLIQIGKYEEFIRQDAASHSETQR